MERLEKFIMASIATLSIIISVLHFLGALENTWLADRIPALTLLVIGSVAGYLILERRNKLDKIERDILEGVNRTITSLDGVEIKAFDDRQEFYEYIVKRMGEARKSIDDLTFGFETPHKTPAQELVYNKYLETIPKICSKSNFSYREVMTFPMIEQLERAEDKISQTKNLGYHLGYYDTVHQDMIPILNFMVIDSVEVILASYRYPYLPIEDEFHLAIRHPEIVRLFWDYYNVIWQGAKIIKDKNYIKKEELQRIRQDLESGEHSGNKNTGYPK